MTGDKGLETLLVWQKSLAFSVEVCKTILPNHHVQEDSPTYIINTDSPDP
jgi:hypothetical protein